MALALALLWWSITVISTRPIFTSITAQMKFAGGDLATMSESTGDVPGPGYLLVRPSLADTTIRLLITLGMSQDFLFWKLTNKISEVSQPRKLKKPW